MDERGLPEWASQYVGIPYKTHGRDRLGCDCWGLFMIVWAEQFGIHAPEYEGADWHEGQKPQIIGKDAIEFASRFAPVTPGEERLGDGLLIRMRGHPFHVGVVLAPGWMLHTHEEADSVIENYRTMTWEKRIGGIYRYEAA